MSQKMTQTEYLLGCGQSKTLGAQLGLLETIL